MIVHIPVQQRADVALQYLAKAGDRRRCAINALPQFCHADTEVPAPILEMLVDSRRTPPPRFGDAPLLSIIQDHQFHPLRTTDVVTFPGTPLVRLLLRGIENAKGVQKFSCTSATS